MSPWRGAHILEPSAGGGVDDAQDRPARVEACGDEESVGGGIEPDHVLAAHLADDLDRAASAVGRRVEKDRLAGHATADQELAGLSHGEARGRAGRDAKRGQVEGLLDGAIRLDDGDPPRVAPGALTGSTCTADLRDGEVDPVRAPGATLGGSPSSR